MLFIHLHQLDRFIRIRIRIRGCGEPTIPSIPICIMASMAVTIVGIMFGVVFGDFDVI